MPRKYSKLHSKLRDSVSFAALLVLLLRLFRITRTTLGLAQRTNGSVPMDLLVTRQARLHRRWLLPARKDTDIKMFCRVKSCETQET